MDVSRARCAVLWVAATSSAVGVGRALLGSLAHGWPATPVDAAGTTWFAAALVWGCAAVGLAVTTWLWLVTSVVLVDAWRGVPKARRGIPEALRRTTLVLCGVALSSGFAGPAVATGGGAHPGSPHVLSGLRLPERAAVVPHPPAPPPHAMSADRIDHRSTVVVAPGDSLWDIAAEHLGERATDEEVARLWPEVYALNRDVIGHDPGLIRAGQRLVLPAHDREGTGR